MHAIILWHPNLIIQHPGCSRIRQPFYILKYIIAKYFIFKIAVGIIVIAEIVRMVVAVVAIIAAVDAAAVAVIAVGSILELAVCTRMANVTTARQGDFS